MSNSTVHIGKGDLKSEDGCGLREMAAGTVREKWLKEVMGLVEQEMSKMYEIALENRRNNGQFEKIERCWRQIFLEFGGKALERLFEATRWTGYEGTTTECPYCGEVMYYKENRNKTFTTLLYRMKLPRAYYRCENCKGGYFPLDKRLDMEDTFFSPGMRKASSFLGAENIFAEGEEFFRNIVGIPISEKTIERFTEKTGAEIECVHQREIEEVLGKGKDPVNLPNPPSVEKIERSNEPTPRNRSDAYVSVDGTTAHMIEGWKEAKLGSVFDAEPFARKDKKGRLVAARGATTYVGSFETAEEFGKRVYVEAYRRSYFQAARRAVLGDGARWIWDMADMHFPDAVQILDWYHANERLWEVARECFGEGKKRTAQWVEQCESLLLKDNVEEVIRKIKRLKGGKGKKSRDEAVTYFFRNKKRMCYGTFRKQGFYIGSGVVESACKHVVGLRLKRPGMRWVKDKANAVLQTRLAKKNHRFDYYWEARCARAA